MISNLTTNQVIIPMNHKTESLGSIANQLLESATEPNMVFASLESDQDISESLQDIINFSGGNKPVYLKRFEEWHRHEPSNFDHPIIAYSHSPITEARWKAMAAEWENYSPHSVTEAANNSPVVAQALAQHLTAVRYARKTNNKPQLDKAKKALVDFALSKNIDPYIDPTIVDALT